MINEQLVQYVRAQRTNGLTKEAITAALAEGGWTSTDVNEAFMAIDGVSTPPPTPKPTPVAPRTIIPPPGAAPVTSTPIGNISSTPLERPTMAPSELTGASAPKKKSSWFLIILILLFVFIIGGGIAVAVFNPALATSLVEMFLPPR